MPTIDRYLAKGATPFTVPGVNQVEEAPARIVRRPNIALEAARILAAAECATPTSSPLSRSLDLVTRGLTHAAERVVDQTRAPEALDVALRVLASLATPAATPDERAAWRDAALAVYDAPPLNDLVTQMSRRSLPGEDLVWALIHLETTHHTRLIWLQANRIARAAGNLNPADLLGWGWQGLRLALRNYDPSLRYAFSTYACTRINGAIRDGIRREGPVPKRLTTYVRRVSAAEEELSQRLGRAPTLVELAEHLDTTLDQLAVASRCAPVVSLDARLDVNPTEDPRWSDQAAQDPLEIVGEHAWREALDRALADLPDDEAAAVRGLIVEERPVAEVARELGVTPRQVRQRAQRGRARLAEALAEWRPLVH